MPDFAALSGDPLIMVPSSARSWLYPSLRGGEFGSDKTVIEVVLSRRHRNKILYESKEALFTFVLTFHF